MVERLNVARCRMIGIIHVHVTSMRSFRNSRDRLLHPLPTTMTDMVFSTAGFDNT